MAFDLDKVIAERTAKEKKRKPYQFKFDEQTFTLPAEVDSIAVRAAAQGDNLTAFRRLLGVDQFEAIAQSPTMLHPTDLEAIMKDYYDFLAGLAAGESSASSTSSRSTAGPSKRTSRATTPAKRSRR